MQEMLAKSRPIEGTVIKTEHQTAGRGQIGSKWHSEAFKNLTASIILYPTFLSARQQFYLNIAVSLAVWSVIKAFSKSKDTYIKWPNDIYVKDKKVAGILIQNTLSGSQIQSSIIGIGLNINQTNFPDKLPNPSALKLLNPSSTFKVEDVLYRFCESLEHYYLQLKSGQKTKLKAEYLEHLLGKGQKRQFQKNNKKPFDGIIQDITEEGKLIIKTEDNLLQFSLKEVTFLF